MTTFVLVPGAGGDHRYWMRLAPLLVEAGHEAVAVDLPAQDEDADLGTYVDTVAAAVGERDEPVVLVAQSLGAFTAPLAASRFPTAGVVLLAPMIPAPGETAGAWWDATGHVGAVREFAAAEGLDPDVLLPGPSFDPHVTFFHDLPPDVLADLLSGEERDQAGGVFGAPNPLERWPDVPTRVLAARHDRLFPLPFVTRLAHERLGIEAEVVEGGHLVALANPAGVRDALVSSRTHEGGRRL
ncbi:alpha/beta hydrolase [Actinomycetospora termitidis]|uniref:Alpha/beta fold hydrolase n=1 Tax=Actinomycetospora termitidis TaxID=3053470 RepID=A0ABT7MHH7_9PSEU|nr:alpha/beta fold hydrolase [Actinomycetospora sp. Odt1-22]MDL5159332.1 alpha/beta fold hydrolase [Actinomycetospora sp. Odt1-22]